MGKQTSVVQHERRRAPRAPERVSVGIVSDGRVATCQTEDISTHGIACLYPHELSLFTMYDVKLALSEKKSDHLETTGVVVRAEPVEIDGRTQYRVALFFSRISPEDKDRLQQFIEAHRSA